MVKTCFGGQDALKRFQNVNISSLDLKYIFDVSPVSIILPSSIDAGAKFSKIHIFGYKRDLKICFNRKLIIFFEICEKVKSTKNFVFSSSFRWFFTPLRKVGLLFITLRKRCISMYLNLKDIYIEKQNWMIYDLSYDLKPFLCNKRQ